ncbi:lipid kinase, YegS/Rv2252/BmrU family [Clostridium sp. DSM 8431]|uniref:YegS/Rv2252/BmrU family lipid kinase n=1 Tax=Clostridium sp. DSM 8431 TaxID=1761781 RepID=UPI0008EDD50A|nr:YegS/Rv2252/BmrU family lipid kinase [Clostridium sp. DSM 8431]SFU47098.1 lipid kinase, YegS/Rv2252/BmrU family [Clostridium sp. DSM 8431]
MKNVRFIYNPYSGENVILHELDKVIKLHQDKGYQIVPYRIDRDKDVSEALDIVDETYKYVLIAGGDGTVDSVVNAMKVRNLDLPIAVLPLGTANDFATFLGMSQDVSECLELILSTEAKGVDIGKINEKYFVNVASSGLFTDVSQKTDVNLKNTIGKLAYYLKGIEEIPNFRKLKVKLTSKDMIYDGEMYLVLVFNGQTAGSFKLANRADVADGMLDVIMIKAVAIREILPLLISILKGEHLDSDKVLYFKTDDVLIESTEDIVTDIDGERGPDFPLHIQCIKDGIKVLGIK